MLTVIDFPGIIMVVKEKFDVIHILSVSAVHLCSSRFSVCVQRHRCRCVRFNHSALYPTRAAHNEFEQRKYYTNTKHDD